MLGHCFRWTSQVKFIKTMSWWIVSVEAPFDANGDSKVHFNTVALNQEMPYYICLPEINAVSVF